MANAQHTTTRRAVIAGLMAAPAAVTMAVVPNDPDARLIAAWNLRQRTLADIEAKGTFFSAVHHSPAMAALFDHAEMIVHEATANTPRGVLAKLWVALSHMGDGFTEERTLQHEAIRRADFNEVAAFADDLDFDADTTFGAIRDLTRIVEA